MNIDHWHYLENSRWKCLFGTQQTWYQSSFNFDIHYGRFVYWYKQNVPLNLIEILNLVIVKLQKTYLIINAIQVFLKKRRKKLLFLVLASLFGLGEKRTRFQGHFFSSRQWRTWNCFMMFWVFLLMNNFLNLYRILKFSHYWTNIFFLFDYSWYYFIHTYISICLRCIATKSSIT